MSQSKLLDITKVDILESISSQFLLWLVQQFGKLYAVFYLSVSVSHNK